MFTIFFTLGILLQSNIQQINCTTPSRRLANRLFRKAPPIWPNDQDASSEPCPYNIYAGVHLKDAIYKTNDARSVQDCALMCRRIDNCLSGNFVQENDDRPVCTLQSSTADWLEKKIVLNSAYFDFDCKKKPHISTKFTYSRQQPGSCGVAMTQTQPLPQPDRVARIVGGFEAGFYSQPWHGLVFHSKVHVCAATLIAEKSSDRSTKWALTAAHCFIGRKEQLKKPIHVSEFQFVFGDQDRRMFSPHIVKRRAKNIHVHDGFEIETLINDIAVVELAEEIRFSAFVLPVCLPESVESYDTWMKNAMCYVCGFGATQDKYPFKMEDNSDYPNRLNCIKMDEHMDRWENTLRTIWISNVYQGPSHGDSGGSIVCYDKHNGARLLLGITVGREVDEPMPYSHFAYVPYYMEWIKSFLEKTETEPTEPSKPAEISLRYRFPFPCFKCGK